MNHPAIAPLSSNRLLTRRSVFACFDFTLLRAPLISQSLPSIVC